MPTFRGLPLHASPHRCTFENELSVWKLHLYRLTLSAVLAMLVHPAFASVLQEAALLAGVPPSVLEGIIKVESGGHPYAINTNSPLGSFRFKSRPAAEAALALLIAKGYVNLDVGLTQVNLRWHPDLYTRPADLLNPRHSIMAAGLVLKESRKSSDKSLKEWVGRYHAPHHPQRAAIYADSVLGQGSQK